MIKNTSRRYFLRAAGGLAGAVSLNASAPLVASLAGLAALASHTSQAAELSGGYKALVCLFMHGGSDSHNWVVPIDAAGYAEYAAVRQDLAWPIGRLLPIGTRSQASGRLFGMPDDLAPLRKWYEAGQAAVVANVGPLVRPVTRAEVKAGVGLPSKLFSHNDQASTWQSLSPEGARSGWGGRMGDILLASNAHPVFTAVSTSGNAVFLSGGSVTQYQVGAEGPATSGNLSSASVFGSSTASAALRRTLATAGNDPLQAEYVRIVQRGLSANGVLQTALPGTSVPAIPGTRISVSNGSSFLLDQDDLARQLRMVAQMLAAGQTLGMRRQVFMVSIGGFDSHANQMRDQPNLMARVANGVDYFLGAVQSLGLLNNVALFTASDFGRALLSNGDGCDHGWGSHHFVAGGALKGRDIVGQFPITALGTDTDIGSGRLMPTTSVTELAASLGSWMGLSNSELAYVLPNLGNFNAARLSLV